MGILLCLGSRDLYLEGQTVCCPAVHTCAEAPAAELGWASAPRGRSLLRPAAVSAARACCNPPPPRIRAQQLLLAPSIEAQPLVHSRRSSLLLNVRMHVCAALEAVTDPCMQGLAPGACPHMWLRIQTDPECGRTLSCSAYAEVK